MSDPRIAEKAIEGRVSDEGPEIFDDDDLDAEDEEPPRYPGRPRAQKLARPRPGSGADELSDEARALVERFVKGLTGRLSSPIKNGIRYESPFPYLKVALDWTLYMSDPHK